MWTALSSVEVVASAVALLFAGGVAFKAVVASKDRSGRYRTASWWSGRAARLLSSACEKRWRVLREPLFWLAAGAAWILWAAGLSFLAVATVMATSTAMAGVLFVVRTAQRSQSYTRGGTRQQRRAARRRAEYRRRSRRRPRAAASEAHGRTPRDVLDALATLGLSEGASREEVQSAYRQQAMKHHPDRYAQHGEAVQRQQKERFQNVQQAHVTLDRYYESRGV